jgi:hypothetical protein
MAGSKSNPTQKETNHSPSTYEILVNRGSEIFSQIREQVQKLIDDNDIGYLTNTIIIDTTLSEPKAFFIVSNGRTKFLFDPYQADWGNTNTLIDGLQIPRVLLRGNNYDLVEIFEQKNSDTATTLNIMTTKVSESSHLFQGRQLTEATLLEEDSWHLAEDIKGALLNTYGFPENEEKENH